MSKYKPGEHPNSVATRFSKENQPEGKGRKKGTRSWDAVFRKLNNSPEFMKTFVKSLPPEWNDIVNNTPAEVIAAGFIMSVSKEVVKHVMEGKPLPKDVRESIIQLNKLGYGDKVVIEPDQSVFDKININFSVVQSARTEDELNGKSE